MMPMFRFLLFGLFAVACTATVGCGGSAPVPVSGTVLVEGQPMQGRGRITFVPLDADGQPLEAKAATGSIENGQFELSTFTAGDGVLPGTHRVEVSQDQILQPAQFEEVRTDSGETRRQTAAAIAVPVAARVPAKYTGVTSPLRETVTAENRSLQIQITRDQ